MSITGRVLPSVLGIALAGTIASCGGGSIACKWKVSVEFLLSSLRGAFLLFSIKTVWLPNEKNKIGAPPQHWSSLPRSALLTVPFCRPWSMLLRTVARLS
jgi:hypothetical protein